MQQLHGVQKNIRQNLPRRLSRFLIRIRFIQPRLDKFDIPVAEYIPDKIVQLLCGKAELVFIQVIRHFAHQMIQFG
ncbi:hypothetical protein SDC9_158263 [bioreactor metagenome]|uniref:Uncharacterized protein n=1 Tax=bioreactor metagenome TaxID=1076179 RepID=A0A645F9A8_9ZZZZ